VTTSIVAPSTAMRDRLARVIAETLRVSPDQVLPNESFASLGMDSLAAVELTAAIEDEIGVELPLTAVHDFSTLELLCEFIEGGAVSAEPLDRSDMIADAVLAEEIRPDLARLGDAPLTRDARSVLLTGATGFVGAFLVRALAAETDADIHCLVRPHLGDPGQRLRDHLARYGVWSDALESRVHVVEGDLTLPRFGMSAGEFEQLAAGVDAVYHAAADVNWVGSYRALRPVNVLGTVEVLRLACTGVPKPVHYLSSVSVCHSTSAPRRVDEDLDALTSIDGLWMGYAQTKCVAESLVRAAGERGLTVTIIRPSLITGDRVSGRSNPDDLVSRFIAGCIRMRAAPDLDWRMDCVPVDDVATSVVRLARARQRGVTASHIAATRPRHWRECVLWMRLAGYDVELIPYREWMDILRETSGGDHPLQSLRSFFLQPIATEGRLTLPELFEEGRRTQVSDARTRDVLSMLGHSSQALTTELLSRYFDDYERAGLVPPSITRPRARRATEPDAPSLADVMPSLTTSLAQLSDDASIEIESVTLRAAKTNDSIVAELTSWRGETRAGLYHADVVVTGRDGRRTVTLFVKSKPADSQVIEVAESVAALASPALGETVARFRDHLGFTRSHVREVALYADQDPRIRRNTPRVFATRSDDVGRQWLVVMESIGDALATTAGPTWSNRAIDAAIAGLAQIHAAGFARRDELAAANWQAPVRDARQRREMIPLWSALATHAFLHSAGWADRRIRQTHERLVDNVGAWADALDAGPRTLIHNDFNSRNIAVRGDANGLSLCAFDWELATMGAPQRDLAELLAFVLPENASFETIARRVEQHRDLLQREAGTDLDREEWHRGFRAALCELVVDRLASYAMVDRIRAQSFLPRVVRGWNNLFHHYPWAG
jgi:acyl carrier protein